MSAAGAISQTRKMLFVNIVLIVLVIVISVVPLLYLKEAEFEGADAEAQKAVAELKAGYEPWFSPIFEPPSGEVESLLFSVQAAVGAGIIGYYIGYARGKRKAEPNKT